MATDANNDISYKVMTKLWGDNWYDIQTLTGAGASDSFIYNILLYMNSFAFTVVVLLFIYTAWVGTTSTAHEGVALGKKFSTIWVPIRFTTGMACLAPIFNGISILQVLILQLVVFSITSANTIYSDLYNDFFPSTSESASEIADNYSTTISNIPGLKESTEEVGAVALKAFMIQQYYQQVQEKGLQGSAYITTAPSSGEDTNVSYYYKFSSPDLNGFKNFLAGSVMANVEIPCATNGALCKKKDQAMKTLLNSINGVASNMISYHHNAATGGGGGSKEAMYKAYATSLNTYYKTVSTATENELKSSATYSTYVSGLKSAGLESKGWMSLGAYYWILSNASQIVIEEASKQAKTETADLNLLENFAISSGDLETYLSVADQIISATDVNNEDKVNNSLSPKHSWFNQIAAIDYLLDNGLKDITGTEEGDNHDVVANLQRIGHQIIWVGNTVMTAAFLNGKWVSKIKNILSGDSGNDLTGEEDEGGVVKKGFGFLAGLLGKALGLACMAAILLYPLGIALAFYLPAIPLLIWTVASLNWIISTMSLMVGAPVWAVAHSMPEGEGFQGARGGEGYLLLLNVLLRPVLMVVGFYLAYIGIQMIGEFLYQLFVLYYSSQDEYAKGFVTLFAQLFIFGGLVIIAVQKIFGLIVHFPDTILNFIGKYIPGAGEAGDEQKINSLFEKARAKSGTLLPNK